MDPQQRLLLEVAWQALEAAGQPLERIRGSRTGVFVGISSSDYSNLLWASSEGYLLPDNEPFVLTGNTGCIAANRVSYVLNLKGPSLAVDTACSSSLVAVHLACQSLWRGEISAALVGGVQALIFPGVHTSFCKAGLLAPDGLCKSFAANADGYGRSEGAAAVLLKPLAAAQEDGDPILALIRGTAVNSDGRSLGLVAPNLRAQVACVRDAFSQAGIDPAAAQYVEAHGTGTRHGDPIELRALGAVLGPGRAPEHPCRVGSVKSNLGHSETAAGITGLIKAALCLQHRQLPPSLHAQPPNPAIDFTGLKLEVQTELTPFPRPDQPAVVGVSSFGFGGTNAHVVLSEAPVASHSAAAAAVPAWPLQLLCLSAHTEPALRQRAGQLAELLRAQPQLALADLCATANGRRSHFGKRLVCLGPDRLALLRQLEGCASGGCAAAVALGARAGQVVEPLGKLAFLCRGGGGSADTLALARPLLAAQPRVRRAFERVSALLDPLLEHPLASHPAAGPALSFALGYALAQLWQSWGLQPTLLLGQGDGEILAAHLAGVLTLQDAVRLVAARTRGDGAELEPVLATIRLSSPKRPWVTGRSGELLGAEITQASQWRALLSAPQQDLDQAMATLVAQGITAHVDLDATQPWEQVLCRLADLHCSGHRIDWQAVHQPAPRRLVALPPYPLQRQRYWWSRPAEPGAPASLWLAHIHPERGPESGPEQGPERGRAAWSGLQSLELPGGDERRFSTRLSATRPADLQHHCIQGQVVFPAAGFLQLALQAARALGQPLALTNLQLDHPLRISQASCELQWLARDNRLEVFSREGQSPWRRHGTAELSGSAPIHSAPIDLAPIQPPASAAALDLQEFYATLRTYGLHYGPTFQTLEALWRCGDRAWARLRRQGPAQGQERTEDWTLLDGCFQAVAASLDPEAAAGQVLLPVGLAAIHLEQWPLPDQLSCQVQVLASDDPALVLANLVLWPEPPSSAAAPLGWLAGLRLRRLPRAALDWLLPQASGAAAASGLVRSHWEPLPPPPAAGPPVPDLQPDLPTGPPPGLIRSSSLLAEGGADPGAAVAVLLRRAQTPDSGAIWLLFDTPDAPALVGALEGFARSAALEQPERQWMRLHLRAGADEASLPWEQIRRLAAAEPALAWDGRQLWRQRLRPLLPERFRLITRQPGLLESLEPVPLEPLPASGAGLGRGELELAVEAVGLNFRDVLNALGLLQAHSRQLGLDGAATLPLGGECVGRVTAVGPGVDPALLGRRLLAALAVGSLASHVTTRAALCVPLPPWLTPATGASLSTAFLTATYGLIHLARLQPGDTLLIHAAAGGVGQAAVQVARRVGARILATASAGKRQSLLVQGVEAVFDSRSLTFAEQVLAHTGGRGVDVVLNSLKGEWVNASFAALARGGRFVELGKIEIWTPGEAAQRRPDATYLPFDLLEVAAAEPQLIRGLLLQVLEDLEAGHYSPLPLHTVPLSQAVEAFRLMAQARHVGKVVLVNSEPSPEPTASAAIEPAASYLITGALGGLGLQLCRWLADQGATALLLVARSAAEPSAAARKLLHELAERGVSCTLIACDLAATGPAASAVERTLAAALAAVPPHQPLRGVFHVAGVRQDGLLSSQTPEQLAAVLAPKLGGWQRLARALDGVGARPFVVHWSSMAALLGSPGQSSYAAANGALDALAAAAPQLDRQLSVQWGPWAGAGMAAAMAESDRQRLEALGVRWLAPEWALASLGDLLRRGVTGTVAVLDLDWSVLAAQLPARQAVPLQGLLAAGSAGPLAAEPPQRQLLASTPQLERQALLVGWLQRQLAMVMGQLEASQIDPGESLFNLGLDSLMALEFTVLVEQGLGVRLDALLVFEHSTLHALAHHLLGELWPETKVQSTAAQTLASECSQGQAASSSDWGAEVAAVAELDPEALLRQLRGQPRLAQSNGEGN